jgi:nitrate reductase delta subunit
MTDRTADAFDEVAALLSYPRASLDLRVDRCLATFDRSDDALVSLQRFDRKIGEMSLAELQEHYTAIFDMDPACTLDLGWHLFGDTRERGGFLVVLRDALNRKGVSEADGLPDHLSHVLSLLAREEPDRASELAALIAPAVAAVRGGLEERRSVYADLLKGVESLIARFNAERRTEVTTT